VAASTTKKTLIRRFDRESLQGYVNAQSFLQPGGVEFLTPSGSIVLVPYQEVKSVVFVRDFESPTEPAKIFMTRPKMDGLWVRMTFRDGEVMDGILPNDLVHWDVQGYSFTPPEPYSNNQKLFVPREALSSMSVLGVVGSPLTRKRKVDVKNQPSLFD
jgi:Family of unknown function (DUF6982)